MTLETVLKIVHDVGEVCLYRTVATHKSFLELREIMLAVIHILCAQISESESWSFLYHLNPDAAVAERAKIEADVPPCNHLESNNYELSM